MLSSSFRLPPVSKLAIHAKTYPREKKAISGAERGVSAIEAGNRIPDSAVVGPPARVYSVKERRPIGGVTHAEQLCGEEAKASHALCALQAVVDSVSHSSGIDWSKTLPENFVEFSAFVESAADEAEKFYKTIGAKK